MKTEKELKKENKEMDKELKRRIEQKKFLSNLRLFLEQMRNENE